MGRIPMITWGAPEDTIRLASGVDDGWLIAQANRFAAFGSPIFLRFYHEMDGDYRRTYVHSAQDFIAAWRHVHDIFVQRGATNVRLDLVSHRLEVHQPGRPHRRTTRAPPTWTGSQRMDTAGTR